MSGKKNFHIPNGVNVWNPVCRTGIKGQNRHLKHLQWNWAIFQTMFRLCAGQTEVICSFHFPSRVEIPQTISESRFQTSLQMCDGISHDKWYNILVADVSAIHTSVRLHQLAEHIYFYSVEKNLTNEIIEHNIIVLTLWAHEQTLTSSVYLNGFAFIANGDTANGSIKTIQHDVPSEVCARYARMQFYWMAEKVCTKSEIIMENHHRHWP